MTQALTDWSGDVSSLVAEMKRQAGVRTDQELARYMGAAQSTVSNWRKRAAVPEAAVLQFERAVKDGGDAAFSRTMAARILTMRLPEIYFDRLRKAGASTGRTLPYSLVAYTFNAIAAELDRQLKRLEKETGRSPMELIDTLLEDQEFLGQAVDWLKDAPASDMLAQEETAIRRAVKRLDQSLTNPPAKRGSMKERAVRGIGKA